MSQVDAIEADLDIRDRKVKSGKCFGWGEPRGGGPDHGGGFVRGYEEHAAVHARGQFEGCDVGASGEQTWSAFEGAVGVIDYAHLCVEDASCAVGFKSDNGDVVGQIGEDSRRLDEWRVDVRGWAGAWRGGGEGGRSGCGSRTA